MSKVRVKGKIKEAGGYIAGKYEEKTANFETGLSNVSLSKRFETLDTRNSQFNNEKRLANLQYLTGGRSSYSELGTNAGFQTGTYFAFPKYQYENLENLTAECYLLDNVIFDINATINFKLSQGETNSAEHIHNSLLKDSSKEKKSKSKDDKIVTIYEPEYLLNGIDHENVRSYGNINSIDEIKIISFNPAQDICSDVNAKAEEIRAKGYLYGLPNEKDESEANKKLLNASDTELAKSHLLSPAKYKRYLNDFDLTIKCVIKPDATQKGTSNQAFVLQRQCIKAKSVKFDLGLAVVGTFAALLPNSDFFQYQEQVTLPYPTFDEQGNEILVFKNKLITATQSKYLMGNEALKQTPVEVMYSELDVEFMDNFTKLTSYSLLKNFRVFNIVRAYTTSVVNPETQVTETKIKETYTPILISENAFSHVMCSDEYNICSKIVIPSNANIMDTQSLIEMFGKNYSRFLDE